MVQAVQSYQALDGTLFKSEKDAEKYESKLVLDSPIGLWKVTTEGDVEGRSTTLLGEHYGHVADIAFSLADRNFYSLDFVRLPSDRDILLKDSGRKAVHIRVRDLKGNTISSNPGLVQNMIKDKPEIKVTKSNYYTSVKLEREIDE